MLVQVRDAQGAVVAKHVVGVGAIQAGDSRTFTLQVEMRGPEEAAHAAAVARPPASERGRQESSTPSPSQDIRKSEPHAAARLPGRSE